MEENRLIRRNVSFDQTFPKKFGLVKMKTKFKDLWFEQELNDNGFFKVMEKQQYTDYMIAIQEKENGEFSNGIVEVMIKNKEATEIEKSKKLLEFAIDYIHKQEVENINKRLRFEWI